MDYTMIENKVKAFVLEELEDAKKHPKIAHNCMTIAYGALQFATNNLFPAYNNDLVNWWQNEIWIEFMAIKENEND